jgi:hypothetical protein
MGTNTLAIYSMITVVHLKLRADIFRARMPGHCGKLQLVRRSARILVVLQSFCSVLQNDYDDGVCQWPNGGARSALSYSLLGNSNTYFLIGIDQLGIIRIAV